MVRLNLSGVWVDLVNPEFELKWKHPIQNSLKGENSTYSTDLTVPLTKNNRLAFDYKIFLDSGKTNIYLYGTLFVNGVSMRVRCYVRSFSNTGITFFLEQFLSGGAYELLKDVTTIDNLFLPEIQAQTKRDVLLDVATGTEFIPSFVPGASLTNIFTAVSENGRPNIYATGLLSELANFYGVTLNNAPTNYLVFANQWKKRTGITVKNMGSAQAFSTAGTNRINIVSGMPNYNIYINLFKIVAGAQFKAFLNIANIQMEGTDPVPPIMTANFYLEDTTTFAQYSIGSIDYDDTVITELLESGIIPAGTYELYVLSNHGLNFTATIEAMICFTDLEIADPKYKGYPNFDALGLYPCYQNLPKVTAKQLIETIALCSGKMVQYTDSQINFIDFENVFGWENAIDVSDKLINWKTKTFTFLQSQNATVTYADGTVIATVKVNDPTLPDTVNNVATINAIRIQDDDGVERITDKVVLYETTDGHFDIIDKLADIYAPLTEPILFEADFKYFEENKKPLLIRQLGGIFIALESIATTKKVITLKLIKIH